jgi:ParB/RepB/Spo0J family partition protein
MNNKIDREILQVSLDDILPNRFQPRLSFDEKALNELAASISQHGIIQPLVVRRLGDKFEIIAGERRYKAATIAGLKTVPVVVMDLSDNESAEIAIVENIQRKEMTALEEAKSFKRLLDRGYLTQEQLALRMGKSQSAIANKLRLLNLSEEVQNALQNEKISERHARSLLSIKSLEEQKNVLNEILNNKLTVKQTDDLIKSRYGINTTSTEEDSSNGGVKNLQAYASALPLIQNAKTEIESNPQLNLINKLNEVEPNSMNNMMNEMKSSDPFDITPVKEASPEDFAQMQQTNKIEQPINLDINKIKQEAQDINKPLQESADIGGLLKPEETLKTPEKHDPEVKQNKFIFDFVEPETKKEEPIEILDMNEPIISKKKDEIKVDADDAQTAIELLKSNIKTLKESGFKVNTEEFDFEKFYQIIIKIDK